MKLSTVSQVLDLIGQGMRLFVPHDTTKPAQVVEGMKHVGEERPPVEVEPKVVRQLFDPPHVSNLHEMQEHKNEARHGWRETVGALGEEGKLYSQVQ